jgi:hypothetical protein
MWLLHLLPDWFFFVLLILSGLLFAATYFLKYIPIPAMYLYRTPIQIGSVLVIFFSTFMMGVMYNENSWLQRAKEMEQKVAEAENKSKEVNVVVEEKIVEKTKVIKEKGRDIIQYVDRWNTKEVIKEVEGPERVRREEVIKYIENCPIPKEMIDIHNRAAGLDKK